MYISNYLRNNVFEYSMSNILPRILYDMQFNHIKHTIFRCLFDNI